MIKKVLVVEDNDLNSMLFCELLRVHDYVAEPVLDGWDVMARARSFKPDLIVMDIRLPHVSGFELVQQLKADPDLKAIPIMAITAYANAADEEWILAAGAEAYLGKPFSLLEFVDAVGVLLSAAQAAPKRARR